MGPIYIRNEPQQTSFRQAQLMLKYGADTCPTIHDLRTWEPQGKYIRLKSVFSEVFLEEQVDELKGLIESVYVEMSQRGWRAIKQIDLHILYLL